jgi:hypothetical protein
MGLLDLFGAIVLFSCFCCFAFFVIITACIAFFCIILFISAVVFPIALFLLQIIAIPLCIPIMIIYTIVVGIWGFGKSRYEMYRNGKITSTFYRFTILRKSNASWWSTIKELMKSDTENLLNILGITFTSQCTRNQCTNRSVYGKNGLCTPCYNELLIPRLCIQKVIATLISIRRFTNSPLSYLPIDVLNIITKHIQNTETEPCWH